MQLDLSKIRVRRAVSGCDVEKVMRVRWEGYKKYFSSPDQITDKFDTQENCVLLLAEDEAGRPVGTIRLLRSDAGRTEIEDFLPRVRQMLDEPYKNFVEATRLSVPHHELSASIKFALKKTYYHFCLANDVNTMLVWVRPPAAREHRAWFFWELGERASFSHPLLGNNEHRTMICDIARAVENWRLTGIPYLPLLIDDGYSNLRFD
jgi:hypothetical protein